MVLVSEIKLSGIGWVLVEGRPARLREAYQNGIRTLKERNGSDNGVDLRSVEPKKQLGLAMRLASEEP